MPHTMSAKKRVRQNLRRKMLNRAQRSALHTALKKARTAAAAAPQDAATTKLISAAFSQLDRAARKEMIKKNEADRRKARLCLLRDRSAAAAKAARK